MAPPAERSFAAILAAGGKGTRFADTSNGDKLPKQFLYLQGRPLYVWSLTTLLAEPLISHVVVVTPPDMVQSIQDQSSRLMATFPNKALYVVAGGDTRQESVYFGLKALTRCNPDFVLVHDAARPFLTADIVDRVIHGVIKFGACTAGVGPDDTIKMIVGDQVGETLDRQGLLLVQTPQAARFDWFLTAHQLASENCLATTDDAAVLEAAGHEVGIVRGASSNVKVTRSDDLALAQALASILFKDRL